MPGRDGTGLMGAGPMTGRGFGRCVAGTGRFMGYGRGMGMGGAIGFGRGCGRFFTVQPWVEPQETMSEKELLKEQKKILEAQLDAINKKMQE